MRPHTPAQDWYERPIGSIYGGPRESREDRADEYGSSHHYGGGASYNTERRSQPPPWLGKNYGGYDEYVTQRRYPDEYRQSDRRHDSGVRSDASRTPGHDTGAPRRQHNNVDQHVGEQHGGKYFGIGPQGFQRSDERVQEDVCELLMQDSWIDASRISVSVNDGVVELTGEVESRDIKYRIDELVEHVIGVREVENRLRVAHNTDERLQTSRGHPYNLYGGSGVPTERR